jgi:hypothetical protein
MSNTITVELVLRDATREESSAYTEDSVIADLEATIDGLDGAIRDLENELDAVKNALVDVAQSVGDLGDVPLRDLEESIQVIVTHLFDLATQ